MSGYRDDRAAREEQLQQLQREIADAKAKLTEDHKVLEELAERAASLEGRDPPIAPAPSTAPEGAEPPAPKSSFPLALGLALAAVIAIGGFMSRNTTPATPTPTPAPSPLAGIPGAPHHVDPSAVLPSARALALAGAELTQIHATYVASDGTFDLDAPALHGRGRLEVTYVVAPPPVKVDPAAPLGAPRPPPEPSRGTQVDLDFRGLHATHDQGGAFGMLALHVTPVAEPKCTARQVWDAAKRAGAPDNAVAQLTYSSFLGRAMWDFTIDGTSYAFKIGDPECRVLTPSEQFAR